MNTPVSRREFLGTSSKAAAGVAAGMAVGTMLRDARAADANEKLTVALLGCGGMGRFKLGNFMDQGCAVAAVCDVDEAQMGNAAQDVENKLGGRPQAIKDYRKVLEMNDLDAVIVGSPDHWHAAMMMSAVAAGKHVYCEKPCSHNVRETRLMLDAARKYGTVVQVGTHQRSIPHLQEARAFIESGELGIISQTHTYTYGNESPDGLGHAPDEAAPDSVDYDMWLGPAARRPFNRRRFHNSWRWYFDYAAGMVGDWNVHLQDIVMWAMGVTAPVSVTTIGGKYVLTDDRDTPDTMQSVYEFGPCRLAPNGFTQTYTMRKASGKPWSRGGYGMDFHGSNGFGHGDRNMFRVEADEVDWRTPDREKRIEDQRMRSGGDLEGHAKHVTDFIECIRTGSKPIASMEEHYHVAVACHLANVAYLVGRQIFWDAEKEMCFTDRELKSPDREANKHLSREYRRGYELPDVL